MYFLLDMIQRFMKPVEEEKNPDRLSPLENNRGRIGSLEG